MKKKVLSELSISTVNANPNEENIFDYLSSNLKGLAERLAPKLKKKPEQVTFQDVTDYAHEHNPDESEL
jgi:poly-D-alanine transfer protein DltD